MTPSLKERRRLALEFSIGPSLVSGLFGYQYVGATQAATRTALTTLLLVAVASAGFGWWAERLITYEAVDPTQAQVWASLATVVILIATALLSDNAIQFLLLASFALAIVMAFAMVHHLLNLRRLSSE